MFARLRSNGPLPLSAAAPDPPLSLKSGGRDVRWGLVTCDDDVFGGVGVDGIWI